MIHTIYTMTIRRYSKMLDTDNENLLKRWYNPFPLKWFNKAKFYKQLSELINEAPDINDEIFKTQMYNSIILLTALHDALMNSLLMKTEVDLFKRLIGKKKRADSKNISYYIELVEELTGIKILGIDDLGKLSKKIKHYTDKYIEMYRPKNMPEVEHVSFAKVAMDRFSALNMNYDPNMTLAEYYALNELVNEKNKPNGQDNPDNTE